MRQVVVKSFVDIQIQTVIEIKLRDAVRHSPTTAAQSSCNTIRGRTSNFLPLKKKWILKTCILDYTFLLYFDKELVNKSLRI